MSREALAFPPESAPRAIWVFLLDIEPSEIKAYEAPDEGGTWPLLGALGVQELDPAQVEVFPEERISEYGMVRYLTEANGMSPETVEPDAATLESLGGVVVMVHSRAVAGREGHFDPAHPARFVGRYEDQPTLTPSTPQPRYESTRGIAAGGATPGEAHGFPWGRLVQGLLGLLLFAIIIWSLAANE